MSVQNWHKEFDKFWPEHLKISNICTLMGCFWPKYIMFEPKKVQRIYVWWYWIVMQNLKESWLALSKMTWHDIFQQKNKAPHFSFFLFFFFFFYCVFPNGQSIGKFLTNYRHLCFFCNIFSINLHFTATTFYGSSCEKFILKNNNRFWS